MDIEHPDIDRIERMGFPDKEYLDYEQQNEMEEEENE